MDQSKLQRFIDAVEEIIQCPICLYKVQSPVVQCSNGHGMCSQCRGELIKCSLCDRPFVDTPMRMLEQVINLLPSKCVYADKGCSKYDILDDHAKFCSFRPIRCNIGHNEPCNWSGTVDRLRDHVNSHHKGWMKMYSTGEEKKFLYPNTLKHWESAVHLLVIDENLFLLRVQTTDEAVYRTIQHVPFCKPDGKYYFQVTFKHEDNILYRSKIKASTMPKNIGEQEDVMQVYLEDLESTVGGNIYTFYKATKKM